MHAHARAYALSSQYLPGFLTDFKRDVSTTTEKLVDEEELA